MKATGIVRRIDDLGRVVIPKEIRRTIYLILIVGNRAVGISVKLCKAIDIFPHLTVVGMEDVCSILMYIYPLNLFGVYVATYV